MPGSALNVLELSQSNGFIRRDYSWSPPDNARFWNNQQGFDNVTGTAFIPIDPTKVCNLWAYGAQLALVDLRRTINLCSLSSGSLDIGHWNNGNSFVFSSSTSTAPSTGTVRLNNANPALATAIYISEFDSTGSGKNSAHNRVVSGHLIRIFHNSGGTSWTFTCNGTVTDDGTWWTIPIATGATGSGSYTHAGGVRVACTPDFYTASKTIVPAWLTAAGQTQIDVLACRFGESDAQYSDMTRFKAEWEEMLTRFKAESWCPSGVKVVIFGISDSRVGGFGYNDQMNTALSELAAADATNRVFVDVAASLNSSYWQDGGNIHMTAAGYYESGVLAAAAYSPGVFSATEMKMRNAANSGWINLKTCTGFKMRNAANSGWIDLQDDVFSLRNATDTGFYYL